MTIQELLDRAAELDPSVQVTVYDAWEVRAGWPPERRTSAVATSLGKGEGSHEPIRVVMGDDGSSVLHLEPGVTTLFWQADALMRAFRGLAWSDVEEITSVRSPRPPRPPIRTGAQ